MFFFVEDALQVLPEWNPAHLSTSENHRTQRNFARNSWVPTHGATESALASESGANFCSCEIEWLWVWSKGLC